MASSLDFRLSLLRLRLSIDGPNALPLRDRRNLIFEPGPGRRRLGSLRESDILSGSDALDRRDIEEGDEKDHDYGLDFTYADRDGLRVAVQRKVSNKSASKRTIDKSVGQISRYAAEHREIFDRGELWVLGDSGSNLAIWRSDRPGQVNQFGLANVVSMEDRIPSDSKLRRPIDSAYVEERIESWKSLIDQLFDQLSGWCQEANYRVDRSITTTMDEELMRLFGVSQTQLPILKIYRDKTFIASAIPIGLWVVGASGRVDLLTATRNASLVNRSNDPNIGKWYIFESQQSGVPLTRDTFIEIVAEQ